MGYVNRKLDLRLKLCNFSLFFVCWLIVNVVAEQFLTDWQLVEDGKNKKKKQRLHDAPK